MHSRVRMVPLRPSDGGFVEVAERQMGEDHLVQVAAAGEELAFEDGFRARTWSRTVCAWMPSMCAVRSALPPAAIQARTVRRRSRVSVVRRPRRLSAQARSGSVRSSSLSPAGGGAGGRGPSGAAASVFRASWTAARVVRSEKSASSRPSRRSIRARTVLRLTPRIIAVLTAVNSKPRRVVARSSARVWWRRSSSGRSSRSDQPRSAAGFISRSGWVRSAYTAARSGRKRATARALMACPYAVAVWDRLCRALPPMNVPGRRRRGRAVPHLPSPGPGQRAPRR